MQLDVTDARSIAAAVKAVREANRERVDGHNNRPQCRIDYFVNNAAVFLDGDPALLRSAALRESLRVNFEGVARTTRAFLPLLGQRAKVLNVSSLVGAEVLGLLGAARRARLESPESEAALFDVAADISEALEEPLGALGYSSLPTPAHGVSKCLLNAWTRLLAKERPDLRVNAIAPGRLRDVRRADTPQTRRGDAAAATWIFL